MKILDAGTEMLDDKDVLKYILDKRAQHKTEDVATKRDGRTKNNRPANYMRALKKARTLGPIHNLSLHLPFLSLYQDLRTS